MTKDKLWPPKKEFELAQNLSNELLKIDINLTPRQRRNVINFVRLRTNYLELMNSGLDKRSIEKDLDFRLSTLNRISKQLIRDRNPYNFGNDDFIKRQTFLALVEKASLVEERKAKINTSDALALDFHLFLMNEMLDEHDIVKPAHTLASILNKAGYWKGYSGALKVSTIQNKISRARRLIKKAVAMKACHAPESISQSPRWHSNESISHLSQDCPKCAKIWAKVLNIEESGTSSWNLALLELKNENPALSEQIDHLENCLKEMPMMQIVDYLPMRYRGVFDQLFEAEFSV